MRGLLIGRFQPFHNGHLSVVRQILAVNDECIIALTGAQFNYIDKDPFTAGEREEMIHESLHEDSEVDVSRCYIIPLYNQPDNAVWVSHLKSILPRFDYIYTGNEYVSMLFKETGIEPLSVEFFDRQKYNATRIRDMISKEDGDWEELVPNAVSRIIKKIDGINRIKLISTTSTKPQEY